MSDKEVISKSLGTLAILFQDKKTSEEFYEIYQEYLSDLPDEVVVSAIKNCICECRFFPTIAEIRQKTKPCLDELRMIEFQRRDEQKIIEEKIKKEKDKIDSLAYTKQRTEYLEDKKIKGKATREEIELLEKIKFGQGNEYEKSS